MRPSSHGHRLDAGPQFGRGGKRPLVGAILDKLQSEHQAAATDIANVRVVVETVAQNGGQGAAGACHPLDQALLIDDLLNRQPGGAGHRVPDIGVAVLEGAGAVLELACYFLVHHQCADRLVAGTQALGQRDHVGDNALLFEGKAAAAASHPAHDLIEDHQHAMAIADRADLPEISRGGRDSARVAPTTVSAMKPMTRSEPSS